MTTEAPELLPCPFCGKPAKFEDGGFNAIRVACSDFDCEQRRRVHKRDKNCHSKLAAHWNTRRAAVAGPRSLFPQGDWQHVQIKAGNPRVVAIQFETAEQATQFINAFAFTASPTPAARALQRLTEDRCGFCGGKTEHKPDCDHGVAPPESTRVEGEQDVRLRLESIAEPWICVEERPCEEAVPVHWNEMITALAAAEQRITTAPADNDAESLLQHVAYSGVEFDDNRMGYVVVQIDRDVWEQIKKLAPTTTKGDR